MKVNHWWPGREYAGDCPIPEYFIEIAEKRGTRYLTVANEGAVWTSASCCQKDFPSRRLGRQIATGRLNSIYVYGAPDTWPDWLYWE